MERHRIQTPIGRAAGLGAAKSGFEHWWTQLATAVALVPLTAWFAASLIALSGGDYEAVVGWLGTPFNTVFMVLLLIALFWHTALGLQVVIEDYVHSGSKIWILIAAGFACFGLAVTGIIATLRIAFEMWGVV